MFAHINNFYFLILKIGWVFRTLEPKKWPSHDPVRTRYTVSLFLLPVGVPDQPELVGRDLPERGRGCLQVHGLWQEEQPGQLLETVLPAQEPAQDVEDEEGAVDLDQLILVTRGQRLAGKKERKRDKSQTEFSYIKSWVKTPNLLTHPKRTYLGPSGDRKVIFCTLPGSRQKKLLFVSPWSTSS